MTATVTQLPLRPSRDDGKTPPNAHGRAHAREETPAAAPAAAGQVARGQAAVRWAAGLTSGASLLAAQPPSMHARWTLHHAAAEFYSAWPLRYARYGWGLWDTYVETPLLYGLSWSGQHPWWRIGTIATLVTVLWMFHVI